MNVGFAIKTLRKEKEMSQGDLSSKVGISQASISQIELGTKSPTPTNLKKICKALGISEPLLYLLATEASDIPKGNKEKYDMLFPAIEGLIKQLAS